ncbi:hypothetical protein E2C01_078284 [Portunus trituberculatus]|uniref:Uncharacterized protein n=1 Tax=Portunus trituberculatus TaxID=210409 RepID=A0A5B7IIB9_PORTR|nr:hypothetical protein [Portunus trituberculatus]
MVMAVKEDEEEENDQKRTKDMNEELMVTYLLVVREPSMGAHHMSHNKSTQRWNLPIHSGVQPRLWEKRIACSTDKLVNSSSNGKEEEQEEEN